MRRRAPRGQNLVLLALTMLFLALMVTITLGVGMRIRQKQELQDVADAAAWSNAVMEARTFNNMALLNRLQVSYWVAMAADESLLSWSGYARGMATAARQTAQQAAATCPDRATRRRLEEAAAAIGAWDAATNSQAAWHSLDVLAGLEAQNIQGTIAGLRSELTDGVASPSPDALQHRLADWQQNERLTRRIIAASGLDDVTVLDTSGASASTLTPVGITRREADCDFAAGGAVGGAGLCLGGAWSENMLHAAMGTRGDPFLTGRGVTPPLPQGGIAGAAAGAGVAVAFGGVTGSGYWGAGAPRHGNAPVNTEAWADDHGSVTVSAGACSASTAITAYVRSTHIDDDSDDHVWPGSGAEEAQRHTMGTCQPECPSVWVRTIGFQPNDDADDAYGQPKVAVALERDLTKHVFPWELDFSFGFNASGPASTWDGRGRQLKGGLDISRQVAWATAIVYYHRSGHWDEFPNLLNPFWRATLAPADIDAQGKQDVANALRGRNRYQGDAYRELVRVGFQGLH